MFSKESFIRRNGEFLYDKFLDFLNLEINPTTSNILISLLSCENIRMFEFEGNQYAIVKLNQTEDVLIIDEVSEEHGVQHFQSRFYLKCDELMELIEKKQV